VPLSGMALEADCPTPEVRQWSPLRTLSRLCVRTSGMQCRWLVTAKVTNR
jgi:hypothetical protein